MAIFITLIDPSITLISQLHSIFVNTFSVIKNRIPQFVWLYNVWWVTTKLHTEFTGSKQFVAHWFWMKKQSNENFSLEIFVSSTKVNPSDLSLPFVYFYKPDVWPLPFVNHRKYNPASGRRKTNCTFAPFTHPHRVPISNWKSRKKVVTQKVGAIGQFYL